MSTLTPGTTPSALEKRIGDTLVAVMMEDHPEPKQLTSNKKIVDTMSWNDTVWIVESRIWAGPHEGYWFPIGPWHRSQDEADKFEKICQQTGSTPNRYRVTRFDRAEVQHVK